MELMAVHQISAIKLGIAHWEIDRSELCGSLSLGCGAGGREMVWSACHAGARETVVHQVPG